MHLFKIRDPHLSIDAIVLVSHQSLINVILWQLWSPTHVPGAAVGVDGNGNRISVCVQSTSLDGVTFHVWGHYDWYLSAYVCHWYVQ